MDKIRFIVRTRAQGDTLTDFLTTISTPINGEQAPELTDTIGPAGRPHTAVVTVSAEHALAFEQRFRSHPHIVIERDRPLSLFDKTASFLHRSERNPNAEKY